MKNYKKIFLSAAVATTLFGDTGVKFEGSDWGWGLRWQECQDFGCYVDHRAGKFSDESEVSGANAEITTHSLGTNFFGGFSNNQAVNNNEIKLKLANEANMISGIVGGYSNKKTATNNKVIINDGRIDYALLDAEIDEDHLAGLSKDDDAPVSKPIKKLQDIDGATSQLKASAVGGFSIHEEANKNSILFTKGTSNFELMGGYSTVKDVKENKVTIKPTGNDKITLYGSVYGGYAIHGKAEGNEIEIDTNGLNPGDQYTPQLNGSIKADGDKVSAIAGFSLLNSANKNKITIKDQNQKLNNLGKNTIAGGYTKLGDANENKVDIDRGVARGESKTAIVGGYTHSGNASSNKVTIRANGTFSDNLLAGGFTHNGDATKNKLDLDRNEDQSNISVKTDYKVDIAAGKSEYGNAGENELTLSEAKIEESNKGKSIYGGYTLTGNASKNKVSLKNVDTKGNIYGGKADKKGYSNHNKIEVLTPQLATGDVLKSGDGVIADSIFVGYANGGNANANIGDLPYTRAEKVYGGYSHDQGDTTYNQITLGKDSVVKTAFGGYSGTGESKNNKVELKDGGEIKDSLYGGYANEKSATSNTALLNSGQAKDIYGGYGKANASDNVVVINNGASVTGSIYGGYSVNGEAKNNAILLFGGKFYDTNIHGGWVNAGYDSAKTAENTLVVANKGISVASVDYIQNYFFALPSDIKENDVMLKINSDKTLNLSPNTKFGVAGKDTLSKLTTGQKIVLIENGGQISGFDEKMYDPNMSSNVINITAKHGLALLKDYEFTLSHSAKVNGGQGINNQHQIIATLGGDQIKKEIKQDPQTEQIPTFEDNKYFDPDKNPPPAVTPPNANEHEGQQKPQQSQTPVAPEQKPVEQKPVEQKPAEQKPQQTQKPVEQKPAEQAPVEQKPEQSEVIVENDAPAYTPVTRLNPQTKALSEGVMGAVGSLLATGDNVAGQGMSKALSAAQNGGGSFAAIGGGAMRLNSGSHVNVKGVNFLIGVALSKDFGANSAMIAPFIEAGYSSYNTYNSFNNAPNVKGSGHSRFVGGGVLGRFSFESGLYAEGSLRAGVLRNKYDSNDLRDEYGRSAQYWMNMPYFSAHAGLGYEAQLGSGYSLDSSVKFFYTHLGSKSVDISSQKYDFNAVKSYRLRAGLRLNKELGESAKLYAGLGYEQEFGSKAKASVRAAGLRYDITAPSIKGGSGMAELGFVYEINKNISFDAGLQGWVGKKQGVNGNLGIKISF